MCLLLLLAVLGHLAVNNAGALTCLTCDDVVQPRHCTTVMTCPDNDVCFIERRVNSFGEEVYALGCMRDHACMNITSTSSTSRCLQCCTEDLCNNEGCDEPGYPSSRGPVCYNCIDPVPDGRCHHIDICRSGEVCSVSGKGMFGTTVFASKCLQQETCGTHHGHGLDLIGKRSYMSGSHARSYDVQDCFQCCAVDICNKNCHISVDGQWGLWGSWSSCTVHCNQTRTRTCDNPAPEHGGGDCQGHSTQIQNCYKGQCQVDGQWGSWGSWSSCTFHCNQTRTRTCDNPAPEHGGRECQGHSTQIQNCYKGQCQVSDCSNLQRNDTALPSGVYTITTALTYTKIQVFCDMETDGGGWTVFQRRFNGNVDFYRNFSDYEHGFGFANGEHWLGLKYIQEITSHDAYQLRVEIVRSNGSKGYDVYGNFSLQPRTEYILNLGQRLQSIGVEPGYTLFTNPGGTPVGSAFSTYDHDADSYGANCAAEFKGGWWYNQCHNYINLNGLYLPGTDDSRSMSYDSNVGLASSTMMLKNMIMKI